MQRRRFTFTLTLTTLGFGMLPLTRALAAGNKPKIAVYKDANCGCCSQWIAHLEANGFHVTATDVDDTGVYRRRFGIPDALGSCHTGLVNGYAIEGHVPAADILALLKQKPAAAGLTVPGMPAGSPGMENPRNPKARAAFDVLLVGKDGSSNVFRRYNAVAG